MEHIGWCCRSLPQPAIRFYLYLAGAGVTILLVVAVTTTQPISMSHQSHCLTQDNRCYRG